jgi:uncharacterized LabA/DUF88 family protein
MIKKVIAFFDGENLVMRYQDMLKNGQKPKSGVIHIPDRFVWHHDMTLWSLMDLVRVNYYTCVVGEDDEVEKTSNAIADTTFRCKDPNYSAGARIMPHVHKKPKSSRKTKVVDTHLTVDVMRTTLIMPVDGIFIGSGDGDYEQLLAEIGRSGKQAYLAAFSSGLEKKLKTRVEQFIDLDPIFFEPT